MMKPVASLLIIAASCSGLGAATSPVFNVLDYGAKDDGSTRSTAAINKAIQACSAAGGGTVWIPAGSYLTGAVRMASNITLHIDAGATLKFHTDLSEYPLEKGRFEGTEAITPVPLIGGRALENVAITGRGTITTSNQEWVAQAQPHRPLWDAIVARLERKETVSDADFRNAAVALRPSFVRFIDSKNVLIDGIHVAGSSMWVFHTVYSQNVVIRNVVVESYPGRNTDGVDIDSCRDVRISDSYFDTGDDAITIKSGRDVDGRRVNRVTENIAVTNCTVHRAHGAVVIGSETAGGVRNVVASNIVALGTDRGIRIKSGRGRGGVIENLRFDNWVIQDTRNEAIHVTNYYTRIPDEPVSERTPIFRNIAISNVTVKNAPVAVSIEGLPEMPVSGLRITDLIASGKKGLIAYNTAGLELRDVTVDAEGGPAFLIRASRDLDMDHIGSRKPLADAPVVRLDGCPGAMIRGSKAWTGTGTFLSVEPGLLKGVVLESNQFGAAKIAALEAAGDFWKTAPATDRKKQKK